MALPAGTTRQTRAPRAESADARAGGGVEVGAEQDHVARVVVRAEHEHLGDEGADLLGREVHDRDHAAADQVPARSGE